MRVFWKVMYLVRLTQQGTGLSIDPVLGWGGLVVVVVVYYRLLRHCGGWVIKRKR